LSAPAPAAPFPFLPRSPAKRTLLVLAAYAALTLAFVVARFPIDRLTPRFEALASAATGARVTVGSLEVSLIALLPAVQARGVQVTWPGGAQLALDRVRVRPAWSLSWLRGDPSLALSLRKAGGSVDGTLRLGATPGFRGDVEKLDLALLPPALLGGSGLALDGKLDADLDLRMAELGPEGTLSLHAAGGSFSLPSLPVGIPYEKIDGDLVLGGDALVTIGSLVVDGPMLAGRASGTVGRGPTPPLAPISIDARIELREPALRGMLSGSGVTLGPDGAADVTIGGTLTSPQVGRGVPGARPPGAPRAPAPIAPRPAPPGP
jgi:type II secretion system protein N